MAMLRKAGVIKSIRGAGGGYILARPIEDISVGDVLRALEGNLEPAVCAAFKEDQACNAADSCVTKYVWQKINESINQTVDQIKLDQLVQESKAISNKDQQVNEKCKKQGIRERRP